MSISFDAELGAGRLRIKLPGLAPDAVAAAAALAQHEASLASLESWLGEALDPLPAASGSDDPGLLWADGDGWRLGLSWPVLAATASSPDLALAWPVLRFDVDVATFDRPPLPEGAGVGPQGGVLLLPGSSDGDWPVTLRAREYPLTWNLAWAGPGRPLQCQCPAEWCASQPPGYRVCLNEVLSVSLPALLGWTDPAAWGPPGLHARLLAPDAPPRQGLLAPALAGTGLWLAD